MVIERLAQEDIKKLREKLELTNKYFELEKALERKYNEEKKTLENGINEIKSVGGAKLQEGAVKVSELNEDMLAMEDMHKKKSMYDFKLMEWRQACRVLQDTIQTTKYDNQIELARMREEIEEEYEKQLAEFTAKASQDAQRSK